MSTSTSGGIGNVLVVDANVLISALLRGKAALVLALPRFSFFTTIRTTWEVERYIPRLVAQLARRGATIDEAALEEDFRSLPISVLPESFYRKRLVRARQLIGDTDPKDAEILALTLRISVPLWTNDRHFDGITEVETITTAELLAALEL